MHVDGESRSPKNGSNLAGKCPPPPQAAGSRPSEMDRHPTEPVPVESATNCYKLSGRGLPSPAARFRGELLSARWGGIHSFLFALLPPAMRAATFIPRCNLSTPS